jgi:tetratricopeptide (TPR) repeat protein
MELMADSKPLTARQLETQAWRLANQGKMKEAIAACSELNRRFPGFAAGWHTASHLAQRLQNRTMALKAIERAVALEPGNNEWLVQQAYCLMQLGDTKAARPIIEQLAVRPLDSAYQYASLGLMLSRLELHEAALEKYSSAIELEPDAGQHHYNLATLQRFLGDFSAAEESLERALQINPADYEAYKLRSDLRRQEEADNHVEQLEAVLSAGVSDSRGEVALRYALAKEQEDLGRHAASFENLSRGAKLRRKHMRYDVNGDLETMARIAGVYGAEMCARPAPGCDNVEPIFILGMPRTGSTLAERILGSHSAVSSAGELNNFALELTRLAKTAGAVAGKTALVDASAGVDFAQLGKAYIDSTRPLTGHTERFIDKMPLNFLYVGLIHRALPRAKIIHLKRDPMDTCYAIYKTLFQDAYPFSYSLEELGQYYLAYHGLMAHWESVMPGVIHHLSYEDLVADTESASRALLEYCELPWEQQCLRFYEQQAASTTASASQVREPVYNSSVGKWRCYQLQLQPLQEMFTEAGLVSDG